MPLNRCAAYEREKFLEDPARLLAWYVREYGDGTKWVAPASPRKATIALGPFGDETCVCLVLAYSVDASRVLLCRPRKREDGRESIQLIPVNTEHIESEEELQRPRSLAVPITITVMANAVCGAVLWLMMPGGSPNVPNVMHTPQRPLPVGKVPDVTTEKTFHDLLEKPIIFRDLVDGPPFHGLVMKYGIGKEQAVKEREELLYGRNVHGNDITPFQRRFLEHLSRYGFVKEADRIHENFQRQNRNIFAPQEE